MPDLRRYPAAAGPNLAHGSPWVRALPDPCALPADCLRLQVLCTTSTLAMGINLPAHLVVIKGTRRYVGSEAEDPSGYQEYERSACLQVPGGRGSLR